MVRPVQPVCGFVAWISRPVYQADCRSWLARPIWAWRGVGRSYFPRAEEARNGIGAARPRLARLGLDPGGASEFTPVLLFRPPYRPDALRSWEPWSVDPPFIDRAKIRWPSDDWPPADPPVVIEDNLPDAPPQIINWRATGGLLDMWV